MIRFDDTERVDVDAVAPTNEVTGELFHLDPLPTREPDDVDFIPLPIHAPRARAVGAIAGMRR